MLKKYILKKLEIKNDDMVINVAQRERNNIKCYTSAFSNIQIREGPSLK